MAYEAGAMNIKSTLIYIRKLESRIHNQRLALRNNWEILETRQAYRKTPLRTMWFNKAMALGKEISRQKKQLP